jgi:N-carbamoyl-L-amino-acid hydrolase
MHDKLLGAIDVLMDDAKAIFSDIATFSNDGIGITREAFGSKETEAGSRIQHFAEAHDLRAGFDRVGNFYAELNGADPSKTVILASHLDSVPVGGNFDGLAGVIAAVIVQAACKATGTLPRHNIRSIGFRCEESPWFGTAYLGSKLALGLLSQTELDTLTRFDTGKSLAAHLRELGCLDTADAIKANALSPGQLAAYLELHIEQGPVLDAEEKPLAVVSAVRGNIRHPFATCTGQYAHSAATPRHLRADTVTATARLISAADEFWKNMVAGGKNQDLVFTCGIFQTDPDYHAMTKVAGKTTFSLNVGGTDNAMMEKLYRQICAEADRLSDIYKVQFDFGPKVGTPGIPLDEHLLHSTEVAARRLGFASLKLPTVGHDAAMFAKLGVPTAMILVRNQNGSHNPDEAMRIEDFCCATKVLALSAITA